MQSLPRENRVEKEIPKVQATDGSRKVREVRRAESEGGVSSLL